MYIDPPWAYDKTGKNGVVQYEMLDTDALASLPIGELGTDESVLLLCCTWPMLLDGIRLIEAWDYKYVTAVPWIKTAKDVTKVAYGIGYWFRGATEVVLVGKRKKSYRSNSIGLLTDGLVSPRLEHSRKPQSLYELGEQFPGPRLEIFARAKTPGWYALGNECPDDGADLRARLDKLAVTDDWYVHFGGDVIKLASSN